MSTSADSPSTSSNSNALGCLQQERTALLHQALTEASVNRAQRQSKIQKASRSSGLRIAKKEKAKINHEVEDQKARIKSHPLAPVLSLLMEKLESATYSLNSNAFQIDDLTELLQSLSSSGHKMLTGDSEIDDLMVESVRVLRRQLAELERVAKLTEQFNQKYTAVIRKLVSHETLIGPSADSDDDLSDSEGRMTLLTDNGLSNSSALFSNGALATLTTPQGIFSIPLQVPNSSQTAESDTDEVQTPSIVTPPHLFPTAFFAHLANFVQQQRQALANENSEVAVNQVQDEEVESRK